MFRQVTIAVTSTMAVFCIAAPARAAPDIETFRKQVDSFVEAEMQAEKVPGAAIAVLRNGEIIIAKGYGRATLEYDVPVTRETLFQSGSVGKMFTAAAIMTLVEQGKIGLDDPLSKYFKDAPEIWRPITIRHLLTHTSGIRDPYGAAYDYRHDYTDDELVKMAEAQPLNFPPGSRWSYSNTGYVLLGIIINRTTGKFYFDLIDKAIFKPLGMTTARGINEADIVPNRASGYELVNGVVKNQEWVAMANPTADGSLYFSLDDVIAWSRGVDQGKVLSARSWQQVYTPVRLNSGKTYPYGFGWMVDQAGGQSRHHHSGSWQGFRTNYTRYLGDGLAIILLTNSAATNTDKFTDGIAGLWDPALVAPAPRPKPEPEIARRVTALLERVRAGALRQEDIPLADPGFAEAANHEYAPMLTAFGPLTKLELARREELGDDIVYTYAATFGDHPASVKFALAPGDKVSSFMVDE